MAEHGSKRAQKLIAEHEETLAAFEYYKKHGKSKKGREENENKYFDINLKYNTLPTFHGYGYADGFEGGFDRADPLLVQAVEALGAKADGEHAELRVVEIPDGISWELDEYDGIEHVAEEHRTWR